jgi:hypothetical protein
MLQVYNYRIIINNHNIGDYHNIYIYRFIPNKLSKSLSSWFGMESFYKRELIRTLNLRLPSQYNYLLKILKQLLKNAEEDDNNNEVIK